MTPEELAIAMDIITNRESTDQNDFDIDDVIEYISHRRADNGGKFENAEYFREFLERDLRREFE